MINTQTQIDSLIDLAVIQRTELKQLIESLPQLRDHLSSEIERNLEEIEPAIRSELEQFVAARALDTQAKTSAELSAKLDAMARNLESTTAAKYSVLMAERAQNATLLAQAEARIAEAASALPGAVKGIVTDELSRFPRAGEIDQLRREFAEPRGLNPRGRWQVGETYNKLDLVSYNGDSYVSNTDGNREKPSRSSEAWTLSAARGNGGGGGGATSLTDLVPVPANGELLIGNGSAFVNNTLTAGTGVTITNGPGSITIDASGAQELLTATVTNAESFAITRGQVVYLFGATGNRASVKLADNSSDAASSKTFGVVSDSSIAANGVGLITCMGVVDGLSLGAYSAGDVLYLGNTPGSVTVTKPYAPNHLVYVGMVERANNGNGEVYVRIQNGFELDEIHDVQITTPPLAGALLMRDATNSLWKANRLTGTANQVTVTNADTAVTLSLPTTIANVNSVTAQSATNLTLAGGSTSGQILFNSPSATERARLTNTGNLLIGTTTDTASRLKLVGTDSSGPKTWTASSAALSGALFDSYQDSGGNGFQRYTDIVSLQDSDGVNGGGVIRFVTNSVSSDSGAEAMRVTKAQNLLIGTTTDISGTGGLKVAGTSTASSTTSGALQVGSNVGLSGNAGGASYFGGTLNVSTSAVAADFTSSANLGATVKSTGAVYNPEVSAFLSPNMLTFGVGGWSKNYFGVAQTAYNSGVLMFSYAGAGSTSNSFGLGIYGQEPALRINGTNIVTVPSTTASTGVGTGALQVAGGIYAGAASVFGGTSPLSVTASGVISEVATNPAGVSVGRSSSSPRISLDTGAGAANVAGNQWNIDNNGGALRAFTAGTTYFTLASTGAATFAGAVTVSGGSNTTSAGAVNLTSSSYGGGYTLKDGTKYLGLFSKNSGTQLCFYTNQAAGTNLGSLTPDLIINTGTSTFAGAVTVSSTTPSTTTSSGALVIGNGTSGGLGVGGNVVAGGFTFGTTPNASYPFYAAGSTAGTPVSMRISHSDGTNATSNARIILDTASGGGDPFINFISGAVEWSLGVDNSASDVFKLSRSGAIGTTDALTIDGSNAATFAGTATLYTVGASSTGENSLIFTGADGNGNVRTPAKITGKQAGNGGYGSLVFQTAFNNSLVDALTINSSQAATFAGEVNFRADSTLNLYSGATQQWRLYLNSGDSQMRLRDMVNSNTLITFTPGAAGSSKVVFNDTTPSTNTTSGALVVTGGVGVGGAGYFGGNVEVATALASGNGGTFTIRSGGGASDRSSLQWKWGNTYKFDAYIDTSGTAWNLYDATAGVNALRVASGNATFAGTVIAPAATTALAPMRIPHGTAPTSPVNGDMWTTTAGLFVRINGVTVGPLS